MPGTTRDSIYIPMERDGQQYTLIDTAGVRKRGKVHLALRNSLSSKHYKRFKMQTWYYSQLMRVKTFQIKISLYLALS